MERAFTQIKDVDKKILEELDDKSLFKILLTNHYLNSLVDENFWRNRLILRYAFTVPYKNSETWKNYYLNVVSYIDKIKTNFNFPFLKGNPYFYYEILSKYTYNIHLVDLDLVRNILKLGYDDLAFYIANMLNQYQNRTGYKISPKQWEKYKANDFLNFYKD